jgi:hypothetical protein
MGIVESAPFQMRTKMEPAESVKGPSEPVKVAQANKVSESKN